jgi:glycosyltransferase involved in cell wall biosynthesis
VSAGKVELVLAIPMLQRSGLHPATFYSVWTMRHSLPDREHLVSLFPVDQPTATARSEAFQTARDVDADALLFIDSDMEFQPDLYQRLNKIDADIACGLFWTKRIPSFPTICVKAKMTDGTDALKNIVPNGKVMDADACGMAATLIRRKVLQSDRFAYPAFKHLGYMGEDFHFCLVARDAGFTIKCDTSVKVAHRGDIAFNGQPILTHPDLKQLTNPFGEVGEASRTVKA